MIETMSFAGVSYATLGFLSLAGRACCADIGSRDSPPVRKSEVAMQTGPTAPPVSVPGLTDHHAHLLRDAAGVAFPPTAAAVASFHRQVAGSGAARWICWTPGPGYEPGLGGRLLAGLDRAAAAGWSRSPRWACAAGATWTTDELATSGPLPCRVRVYLASGLADESWPGRDRRPPGGLRAVAAA